MSTLNRRTAVKLAAVGGVATTAAACGGDVDATVSGSGTNHEGHSGSGSGDASSAAPSSSAANDDTIKVTDIPEGGGLIFADLNIVVTQPDVGVFKAFAAVCTHQGCTVGDVTDTINCPCHGGKFSISDGSVVEGPPPAPLEEKTVTVDGDAITVS